MADPTVPTFTVVAGPNGAGKSTLVAAMAADGYNFGPFVNPDVIAAGLPAGTRNREVQAGKLAIGEARAHIAAGRSFTQESTLTGNFPLRLMTQAKEAGFTVNLLYVGVADLSVSRDRVSVRVAQGGHDIPLADQERRFSRSRENIGAAAKIADNAVVLDNSRPDQPYLLSADIEKGKVRYVAPQGPAWSRQAIEKLPEVQNQDRQLTPFAHRVAVSVSNARESVTRQADQAQSDAVQRVRQRVQAREKMMNVQPGRTRDRDGPER